MMILSLATSVVLVAQTKVTADMTGTQLQNAINAAEAGTTVYVQAGTYYGNFQMKEGLSSSSSAQ